MHGLWGSKKRGKSRFSFKTMAGFEKHVVEERDQFGRTYA